MPFQQPRNGRASLPPGYNLRLCTPPHRARPDHLRTLRVVGVFLRHTDVRPPADRDVPTNPATSMPVPPTVSKPGTEARPQAIRAGIRTPRKEEAGASGKRPHPARHRPSVSFPPAVRNRALPKALRPESPSHRCPREQSAGKRRRPPRLFSQKPPDLTPTEGVFRLGTDKKTRPEAESAPPEVSRPPARKQCIPTFSRPPPPSPPRRHKTNRHTPPEE